MARHNTMKFHQADVDRYKTYSYDELIDVFANTVVDMTRAKMLSDDQDMLERLRHHVNMLQYVVHVRYRNGDS